MSILRPELGALGAWLEAYHTVEKSMAIADKKGGRKHGFVRWLSYARYLFAGAIGGIAVLDTYALVMASHPGAHAETYAMAAGAAILVGAAKALHAV